MSQTLLNRKLDLHEVEVEILILAKTPSHMRTAASFLTRRGWPTTVYGSMTKAVEHITKNPPDIVLVSFNHPNPSAQRLPILMQGKFDIVCVAFVEGADPISTNMLTAVKFPHKIFGQPSGPNLQRGVRRILAQHYQLDVVEPETAAEEFAEVEVKKRKTLKQWRQERSSEGPMENMARAVEAALTHLSGEAGGLGKVQSLRRVSRVGVFPVESDSQPGYLVVAAEPGTDNADLLQSYQKAFHGAFASGGVPGRIRRGFWIELPKTDFAPWAHDHSTFNITRGYQGAEMGVAFFQGPARPVLRPTADRTMMALQLNDIPVQQPLQFKAYLHLKQNKRYYLYLRPGRSLQPEQKARLQERQVGDIFIKPGDVEQVEEFIASSFLKSTLKDAE